MVLGHHRCVAAAAAGLLFCASARGAIVSVNFVGTAGANGTLAPTDQAGSQDQGGFVTNWNNAAGASGTLPALLFSDGTSSNASITWLAPGTWQLPDTTAGANLAGGANPQMMKGYLDFPGNGVDQQTTITMTGLVPQAASYSVVVYFDGDNGGAWRVGNFTIGGTTLSGEDSENVNFNDGDGQNADGLFQIPVAGAGGNQPYPTSPNNGEGNMVVFTGLTSPTFTLTAVGGPNQNSATFRAPVNGIQVIGVAPIPEPATAGLLGVAAIGLLARRRRS